VEVLGEKPVPVPLYPPHVSHGLIQDQTWASIVRRQQLKTQAMEQAVPGTTNALRKVLKHTVCNPTENIIISITKTTHLMLFTKLTAVYCQSYEAHKPNVCPKCT
jgi:predicted  nucleic acid-binding Zn ribbon protein